MLNLLTNQEPSHIRCKTCPFISNTVKISVPNRSVKVTGHFTCIFTNVVYCITCMLCKKMYMGKTGRRLAGHFHKHLRAVERNNTDGSKPVVHHFNLRNHSHHNMAICGLSLHHGNRKLQNSWPKIHFSTGYALSTRNLWTPFIPVIYSLIHVTILSPMAKVLYTLYKPQHPTIPPFPLMMG